MRIIFIFPRSWAWQGVEKLNSKMASLRILGVGVANALTRPVQIFLFSTMQNFFNFPQQHYNIFQQIFHIITPSKSQYKKRGKIIIHLNRENVKRGVRTEKMGVCRVGLRCVFHRYAILGVFQTPLYIQCPFVSI